MENHSNPPFIKFLTIKTFHCCIIFRKLLNILKYDHNSPKSYITIRNILVKKCFKNFGWASSSNEDCWKVIYSVHCVLSTSHIMNDINDIWLCRSSKLGKLMSEIVPAQTVTFSKYLQWYKNYKYCTIWQ